MLGVALRMVCMAAVGWALPFLLGTALARGQQAGEPTIDMQWAVKIPARDGVKLNATVFTPHGQKEPLPVVFTLRPGLPAFRYSAQRESNSAPFPRHGTLSPLPFPDPKRRHSTSYVAGPWLPMEGSLHWRKDFVTTPRRYTRSRCWPRVTRAVRSRSK